MPPRREIDPDPVLRTLRAYTGAEFEGQLLNRGRGEQMEGVDIVNARDDSREPQHTVEQPGLRPVSATPPAADAHAQGSALPVPTRQANQDGSPYVPSKAALCALLPYVPSKAAGILPLVVQCGEALGDEALGCANASHLCRGNHDPGHRARGRADVGE